MPSKLLAPENLSTISRENKIVVFTNGCFDLLHEGHLHLLREAKKLGDILIVGLNSDASVKRLKGENRPAEDEMQRAEKLSQMEEVDYVIIFSEDTPALLIESILPDVLVKGGDYSAGNIAGADFIQSYGGRVVIIPLLEGFSTTAILNNK